MDVQSFDAGAHLFMYFTLTNDADTVLSGVITFGSATFGSSAGGGAYKRQARYSITLCTMIQAHHSSGLDLF